MKQALKHTFAYVESSSVPMTLEEWTASLPERLARGAERGQERAAIRLVEELARRSPSPGTLHPYATGDFAASWRAFKRGGGWAIVNDAPAAAHIDAGSTRYGGQGSAEPFRARGIEGSYSAEIAADIQPELEQILRGEFEKALRE